MKNTFTIDQALLGHKLIVARSGSGMSFQPENLRRQRMLNRVNCHSADPSSLENTGAAFVEIIVGQCTTKL